MKINITAQDYFEELKLMEQQYGQEEDLYPWIYMLLQMAECKKKEQNIEYKRVSIRDVHNAHGGYEKIKDEKNKRIRAYIKRNAVPEFAIFNDDGTMCLGCVEIKALSTHYISEEVNEIELSLLEPLQKKYEIKFRFEDEENVLYSLEVSYDQYKKISSVEEFTVSCCEQEKEKNLYIKCAKNNEELLIIPNAKFEKYNKRGAKPRGNLVNEILEYTKNVPLDCDIIGEMYSHLEKCKKVIYTNGLQFIYFELEGEKVTIKKIANLTECYDDEKLWEQCSKEWEDFIENPIIEDGKFVINDSDGEWTKLIKGLANINWHEEPTTLISTDN